YPRRRGNGVENPKQWHREDKSKPQGTSGHRHMLRTRNTVSRRSLLRSLPIFRNSCFKRSKRLSCFASGRSPIHTPEKSELSAVVASDIRKVPAEDRRKMR